jgi:RNA polymerase sigma-70 factor (ECF subfamily)
VRTATQQFEKLIVPHLDAGYNLARWMMGQEADARDVVQVAALRALTFLDGLRGLDARAWFLGIVRNCCYTALRERTERGTGMGQVSLTDDFDELVLPGGEGEGPEQALERAANRETVNSALRQLPVVYREALVLRDMHDLSYEEIAGITGAPLGTVMSRLARARRMFRQAFEERV